MVRFVKRANLDICNEHIDWKFLWFDYSETIAANAMEFPQASAVDGRIPLPKYWITSSLWLNRGLANPIKLEYVEWQKWRANFRSGVIQTVQPAFFTVRPDHVIELDAKCPSSYIASGEFWRRPYDLLVDADEPLIPKEYHRIIEVRAKMYYAEREDAPEIMTGSMAEHDVLMQRMEASELPDQAVNNLASAEDYPVEVP